jgi:hypothetical protein
VVHGATQGIDRGIDRKVAMSITGHRMEAVYNSYNIADLADIAKATAKLDDEQKTLGGSQGLAKVASQRVQGPQPLKVEVELSQKDSWWAHQDSNLGPTDYESAALTD